MLWNDCTLIFSNGRYKEAATRGQRKSVAELISKYGGGSNVWWDNKDDRAFSISKNALDRAHKLDRSFLCRPDKFNSHEGKIVADCGGSKHCRERLGEILGDNCISTSEYIAQNRELFKKFKGKRILIVAAGPSAVQKEWLSVEYDYLWSCNHFFQNEHLARRNVDLWMPSDSVDIANNADAHSYMKRYENSWCCIYPTERRNLSDVVKAKEKMGRVTYAHLRYRSKLGVAPRLVVLAALCEASEVALIGVDGMPTEKTLHAFEPNKRPSVTAAKKGAVHIFRRQYVELWDYILNHLKSKTKFVNLGEHEPTNLSASISKKMFPLRSER